MKLGLHKPRVAIGLSSRRFRGDLGTSGRISAMRTKPSHKLSFRDRLSRLSFEQACKLLGPKGQRLIQQGGKREIDLKEHVYLGGDLLRVRFPGIGGGGGGGPPFSLLNASPKHLS